jgi:hypothetical protein
MNYLMVAINRCTTYTDLLLLLLLFLQEMVWHT